MVNTEIRLEDVKNEVLKIGEVWNGVKESQEAIAEELNKLSEKLSKVLEVLLLNSRNDSSRISVAKEEEANVNTIKDDTGISEEGYRTFK